MFLILILFGYTICDMANGSFLCVWHTIVVIVMIIVVVVCVRY